MTEKEKLMLKVILMEIKDDIETYGETTGAIVFYEVIDNIKYFVDYEIAESSDSEYSKLITDKKELEAYKNIDKTDHEIVNIVYNNEKVDLMGLKELMYLVYELLEPNQKSVLNVNLLLNDMSEYRLAQKIKISKQALNRMVNNQRPIPDNRKGEIANILKFNIDEFDRNPFLDWKFKE